MKTHRNQSQPRIRKAASAQAAAPPPDLGLRFQILNEQAPLAIGVSRRGIGVYANPRLVQMFGLRSAAEWIGRPVIEFFAPQARGESRDRTRRRNLGLPVPAEFESIGLRADGSQFPIHVAVARAQLDDGPTNIAFITDITGRRQAEAALAKSEMRFRTLIEQAPIAISISRGGSGVYANRKLAQLFGLRDGAAWVGRPMLECFAPQVRDEARERMRRQSLGLPVELEWESVAQRPDGSQFPVHVAITVMTLADGPANVAFITDITERKRAEQVLTENEVKLRALFEGSGYAMGLAKEAIHIMVNPAYAELFGYANPAELVGKSLLEDIAPEERPRLREFVRLRTQRASAPQSYETRGLRRDGTVFDMAVRVSTYEVGGEVHTIGILRDITAYKQAEAALRTSEERFSKAFHLSLLSIAISTLADGIYREVNDSFLRTTGYRREEVLGRTSGELGLWVDERRRQEVRRALVAGKAVREMPAVLRGRGGALHDVLYSAVTIKLGGVDHVLSLVLDITERTRAEVALRASQEQLRALAARIEHIREEERAGLARELHDELGQGLTALQIDLSGLDAQLQTAGLDDLPGLRDKIAGMVPRAESLIETTQTISANMRPGVLDDLGLVAAVEWLAADFEKRTGLACAAKLPATDLTLDLGLAVAMFRIVQEALTNVIRHAKASRVEIRLQATEGELQLDILDDGRGITSSKIEDGGSLGLFSMRERAAEFGGTVAFRGEAGRGTTVSVRMPWHRPTPAASHENPHR
ncbi:MAG TPA: PAS domain S-box protein [Opitutaceae bacterium]|nr:PAS domain S-box protein [Opitutaceae bacterium]